MSASKLLLVLPIVTRSFWNQLFKTMGQKTLCMYLWRGWRLIPLARRHEQMRIWSTIYSVGWCLPRGSYLQWLLSMLLLCTLMYETTITNEFVLMTLYQESPTKSLRSLASEFYVCSFKHVGRKLNVKAHTLACCSKPSICNLSIDVIPDCIQEVLCNDVG
jgi:hypothetical protein